MEISSSKSLESSTGAFEFAKQFWVMRERETVQGDPPYDPKRSYRKKPLTGLPINLSPVSAKAVLAANSHIQYQQLARRYNLSNKTVVRLAGGGYRVLGQLGNPSALSRRWKRILALSHKLLVSST